MSQPSDRVIAGFMRLKEDEQQEVIGEINNYIKQSYIKKRNLRESFEKTAGIVLGPTGGGCPCCGR